MLGLNFYDKSRGDSDVEYRRVGIYGLERVMKRV